MQSDTVISTCGKYRYVLIRTWSTEKPVLGIVALNPSTADAATNDPTVVKCIKLAKFWGYGGIVVVNLFAWRATDKGEILQVPDPVGPDNDQHLSARVNGVKDVLAAWGNDGLHLNRSSHVRQLLAEVGKPVYCIRKNRTGEPVHPLYQSDTSERISFELA